MPRPGSAYALLTGGNWNGLAAIRSTASPIADRNRRPNPGAFSSYQSCASNNSARAACVNATWRITDSGLQVRLAGRPTPQPGCGLAQTSQAVSVVLPDVVRSRGVTARPDQKIDAGHGERTNDGIKLVFVYFDTTPERGLERTVVSLRNGSPTHRVEKCL